MQNYQTNAVARNRQLDMRTTLRSATTPLSSSWISGNLLLVGEAADTDTDCHQSSVCEALLRLLEKAVERYEKAYGSISA